MADYYNEFSFVFDLGSEENTLVARRIAQDLKAGFSADDEGSDGAFSIGTDDDAGPGRLWIYSERTGDIGHVVTFVLGCAAACNLTGTLSIQYTHSCSHPKTDGFGGGAQVIDLVKAEVIDSIDTFTWLGGRGIKVPLALTFGNQRKRKWISTGA